ncbi:hypothetical protein NQ314_021394 [Rhamnusium bicolor]|uniref:Uncharacterized protein n=1 Tax=Rhamnusium bicolor TaxID=1586634 RepID=A0AAV8WIB8_9CUCU|nr:hypothetical protein NQ314_021394 [Rhamnusium bicolor]
MHLSGYPIKVRLDSRSINMISTQLTHFGSFFTYEFIRKPRSLSKLPRFKTTEFLSFLIYIGPIVLNKTIDIALRCMNISCYYTLLLQFCCQKDIYRQLVVILHKP